MNRPRAAGTAAETKVERWLQGNGYPYAKKLRQAGAVDVGDIALGDGYPICIEVKGGQKAVSGISGHIREMLDETANSKSETGVVISKKARCAKVDDWVVSMTGRQWLALIKQIYPPPTDYDDEHAHGQSAVRRRIRIVNR